MTGLTSGVSKLIERIKHDGITAGKAKEEEIIRAARAEAARLTDQARKRADTVVAEAEKEAADIRARTNAELHMAVRDFLARFQQRMKDKIIRPVIAVHLAKVLEDEQFLAHLLHDICRDYARSGGGSVEAVVSPEMKEKLAAFFTRALSEKLQEISEPSISAESGLVGFRLRRQSEGFAWDFTLEAIASEISRLVEPGLKSFLEQQVEIPALRSRQD